MTEKQESLTNTTDLAKQRTEIAFKRVRMDNERTLIAWLRTGLAITGFGALVPKLLDNIGPEWLVELIAAFIVIVGLVTLIVGIQSYRETTTTIPETERSVSWWVAAIIVGAIQVGAIVILILFILD